jgi:hypothetical protein
MCRRSWPRTETHTPSHTTACIRCQHASTWRTAPIASEPLAPSQRVAVRQENRPPTCLPEGHNLASPAASRSVRSNRRGSARQAGTGDCLSAQRTVRLLSQELCRQTREGNTTFRCSARGSTVVLTAFSTISSNSMLMLLLTTRWVSPRMAILQIRESQFKVFHTFLKVSRCSRLSAGVRASGRTGLGDVTGQHSASWYGWRGGIYGCGLINLVFPSGRLSTDNRLPPVSGQSYTVCQWQVRMDRGWLIRISQMN